MPEYARAKPETRQERHFGLNGTTQYRGPKIPSDTTKFFFTVVPNICGSLILELALRHQSDAYNFKVASSEDINISDIVKPNLIRL